MNKTVGGPPPADRRGGPISPSRGPDISLQRARAAHRRGQLNEAATIYQQMLRRNPRDANALFELGHLTARYKELDAGLQMIRQAIMLEPGHARFHVILADVLHTDARYEESLVAARRAMELDPREITAHCLVADCLERGMNVEEAIRIIQHAKRIAPHDERVMLLEARLEARLGRLDESRTILETIVYRDNINPTFRQRAWHGLGMTLDRQGQYAEAFAAFNRSAEETAARPEMRRLDPHEFDRFISKARRDLNRELLQKWARQRFDESDDRPAPVFLVGFHRSGTTMMENILAAHPKVRTSNESPALHHLRYELIRRYGADREIAVLDELDLEQIRGLRTSYWRKMEARAGGDVHHTIFIDKLPLNLLYVGLISVVFPDSRLIVALRDPRDVVLSCFMQDFRLDNANARLLTVAGCADFYAEVMTFYLWVRGQLALPAIEVRYEDVVRDLSGQARRMLDHLGVEWSDEVLRFNERAAERMISTPSYLAVTRKVHTGAIGRWRNYEQWIGPLLPTLVPFIDAFGYGDDR